MKYGEWKIYYDGDYNSPVFYCSECGYVPNFLVEDSDVCPNCGAIMTNKENQP